MGKKQKQTSETTSVRKNNGIHTMLKHKAKRVLQSNGLEFFKKWAERPVTGGRGRKKAGHNGLKSELPSIFRSLVAQGEASTRKMDQPRRKSEE